MNWLRLKLRAWLGIENLATVDNLANLEANLKQLAADYNQSILNLEADRKQIRDHIDRLEAIKPDDKKKPILAANWRGALREIDNS